MEKPRGGRPNLGSTQTGRGRAPRLEMRVTRELLEGVTAAAQRRGVPLSVYMRDALVAALADDQPDDLTAA